MMSPLFYLPYMLPVIFTLRMITLSAPTSGPSFPAVRDTFVTDLE
jgi:hypothetical protein